VEYQQIGAWWHSSVVSTDACFFLWGGAGVQESVPVCGCWVVFGTLLGPEATGPGFVPGFVCFWFPGCIDHACCVWGVWFGVVV
jgi:hypothetical protein